ncbi:tyrosine decarboxylase-like isoform X1 [Amphibalanus amphitrite]|uniref:tyrosine decarboxylase-like isoform X1 n=1 Tax=Amphibalanus amphitrite TaxID=1232801 RepID=UPI001C9244B5|nr:tyrosine decarboxylase-like isoform X1 [Amphibalanus amphitrite]
MDHAEFRQRGRQMVDYIADYMESLHLRRVTPDIEPGYLRDLIPYDPPEDSDTWEGIMKDLEKKIMPGMVHWQHPQFHAYFPAGNSYPSILADMLSGLCVGFSWAASPACTELETIVLDWLGKMIGLPDQFLSFTENSVGGGVIQTSASECVLVSLLAARAQAIRKLKQQHPTVEEGVLLSKLMAYCSKEAHSCVEKAAMISFVKLRILEPDERFSLRGATLKEAMDEDRALGLVPFFVSTTLGTTSCCSFDRLDEVGPVCRAADVWLHVDSAYAGNAFICPEFKPLMKGIEYAMSFNMNPNKWMLVNFDCSTMWVRDRFKLTQALVVDPLYLQHNYSDKSIDYRHWGIPLSRRFRSLKLWFVIRSYGVEGLRRYIREHVRLAKRFSTFVEANHKFELMNEVKLGLVCFRLRGTDALNQKLLTNINASGKLHMVPASMNDVFVIRFCVCAQNATEKDILYAWTVIVKFAEDLLAEEKLPLENKTIEALKEVKVNGAESELAKKNREALRHKRSFFVRMVSDPKLYNPKIVKTLPRTDTNGTDSESEAAASLRSPSILPRSGAGPFPGPVRAPEPTGMVFNPFMLLGRRTQSESAVLRLPCPTIQALLSTPAAAPPAPGQPSAALSGSEPQLTDAEEVMSGKQSLQSSQAAAAEGPPLAEKDI